MRKEQSSCKQDRNREELISQCWSLLKTTNVKNKANIINDTLLFTTANFNDFHQKITLQVIGTVDSQDFKSFKELMDTHFFYGHIEALIKAVKLNQKTNLTKKYPLTIFNNNEDAVPENIILNCCWKALLTLNRSNEEDSMIDFLEYHTNLHEASRLFKDMLNAIKNNEYGSFKSVIQAINLPSYMIENLTQDVNTILKSKSSNRDKVQEKYSEEDETFSSYTKV